MSSFPKGSGGGLDGLLPQHLKDLLGPTAGDGGGSLLRSLVGLSTLILEGRIPLPIRPLFFGANLTALTKKSGGIRPIAVGCTLRRLASKCVCQHALKSIPEKLAPHQLGFGVGGGSEAAVHAGRVYLSHLQDDKAMVKVDFQNAFNTILRDKMLKAIGEYIPDLLPYVHAAYSIPSTLLWSGEQVISAEGIQQGDPLGPMLFCLTIHKLVSSLSSEFSVFYLDDGTLGGNFEDLQADLHRMGVEGEALGLHLNVAKSELIAHSLSTFSNHPTFAGLQHVHPDQAMLLGSPLGIEALDACLEAHLRQLHLVGERLCHLQTQDAMIILRHSFAIPKLLHVLRTSPAFSSPHLASWDNILMSIVSRIINIDFRSDDIAWLQATLPVNSGGLGIRRASHLATSAFLASADGAAVLMMQLLPAELASTPYPERDSALSTWKIDLPEETPLPSDTKRQKSWDEPKVQLLFDTLLARCEDQVSRVRLLAAGTRESGAWLNAPPISSLGLCMSNDTVRIASGLRVGAPLCMAHMCSSCGTQVDEYGHHGLSCRFSQGRTSRHQSLNNIIHHSMASANVPSRLEPSGLYRSDGNRPDGVTMTPWSNGRLLV